MEHEVLQQILGELQGLKQGQMKMDQRLDKVDQRLDKVDQRLDKVDQRLDKVDQRLDKVEQRLDKVEQRLDKVEQRLDKVDQELSTVNQAVLHNRVLIEENRRHLRLFAEGYGGVVERIMQPAPYAHKDDVEVLKRVVTDHSKEIAKLKAAIQGNEAG